VKAFLAQAKEEFNKKWDEPAQVGVNCSVSFSFLSVLLVLGRLVIFVVFKLWNFFNCIASFVIIHVTCLYVLQTSAGSFQRNVLAISHKLCSFGLWGQKYRIDWGLQSFDDMLGCNMWRLWLLLCCRILHVWMILIASRRLEQDHSVALCWFSIKLANGIMPWRFWTNRRC